MIYRNKNNIYNSLLSYIYDDKELYMYIYICTFVPYFSLNLPIYIYIYVTWCFIYIYIYIYIYIAILANTPNQAETLLHCLERAAAAISLHVNARKTEYMCFNQTGDISTLDGTSLKLVDKFTYLGSSVSSTEKDIDTRVTKAWTAIDKLSII